MMHYNQAKSSVIIMPISSELNIVIYSSKSACIIRTSYLISLVVSSVMEDNKH